MLMSKLLLCMCLKAAFVFPGCVLERAWVNNQPCCWGCRGAVPGLEMQLLGGSEFLCCCTAEAPWWWCQSAVHCQSSWDEEWLCSQWFVPVHSVIWHENSQPGNLSPVGFRGVIPGFEENKSPREWRWVVQKAMVQSAATAAIPAGEPCTTRVPREEVTSLQAPLTQRVGFSTTCFSSRDRAGGSLLSGSTPWAQCFVFVCLPWSGHQGRAAGGCCSESPNPLVLAG